MEAKHLISFRITFLLSLLLVASTVSGQYLEIPQNEFALSFSKDQLELSRGEKGELEILILKSKGYQKSKTKMGVSSSLPKGVTVTFSPDKGAFDSSKANISIQADATPGQYMLILNATLNNKTKGMILKLLID
jgi:hypothetical protein